MATAPTTAPSAMDRLNTATNSEVAASVACGAAVSIHICSDTETAP
jgi:hypothetical protein